jgi:hypothetical protein
MPTLKTFETVPVALHVPVEIEQGDGGLFYLTSKLVPGLLIAEPTKTAAKGAVQKALREMAQAIVAEV